MEYGPEKHMHARCNQVSAKPVYVNCLTFLNTMPSSPPIFAVGHGKASRVSPGGEKFVLDLERKLSYLRRDKRQNVSSAIPGEGNRQCPRNP